MIDFESNEKLWIKAIAIVVSILILTIGGLIINSRIVRSVTLIELTKAGIDPLSAECAVEGVTESNKVNCAILSVRKN